MTRAPHLPAAALAAGCALLPACGQQRAAPPNDVIPVHVRGHQLQAEVAATPQTRARGLMFRRSLGEDEAMLFVFGADQPMALSMRNTFIPLTIAFLDEGQTIVHVSAPQPFDETVVSSPVPAAFALQLNQGWLQTRGLGPGDRASFTLPAGAPR